MVICFQSAVTTYTFSFLLSLRSAMELLIHQAILKFHKFMDEKFSKPHSTLWIRFRIWFSVYKHKNLKLSIWMIFPLCYIFGQCLPPVGFAVCLPEIYENLIPCIDLLLSIYMHPDAWNLWNFIFHLPFPAPKFQTQQQVW